jgi:hypothetical protein
MSTPTTLYAAKCYWPGVTESALEQAAARAAAVAEATSRTASGVRYLGSILFQDDELVLCLFDAPSRAAVSRTTRRAGIPCERVMASRWLSNPAPRSPDDSGPQHPAADAPPRAHGPAQPGDTPAPTTQPAGSDNSSLPWKETA